MESTANIASPPATQTLPQNQIINNFDTVINTGNNNKSKSMGLLTKAFRPRSMFKRRATAPLKTSKKSSWSDQDIDDSGRTCHSMDSYHHQDLRSYSSSSSNSNDSLSCCKVSSPHINDDDTSLDECLYAISSSRNQDVLDLIERRLDTTSLHSTRRRSSTSTSLRQVSFLDEELGLTPRHLITSTHYRPLTTLEEKDTLYYNNRDFDRFDQEELYEKIEREIEEIERLKKESEGGSGTKVVVTVTDEMKLRNLIRRVGIDRRVNM